MEDRNKKFEKLVNDRNVLSIFCNLYDRWQAEKEYEDFNDYVECMHNSVGKVLGVITDVKGTKRPFGIKFTESDGVKFHLHLKTSGTSAWLCIKRVA